MDELIDVMKDILSELEDMNSKLNNLEDAVNSLESTIETSTREIQGYNLADLSDIKSELEIIKLTCESMDQFLI